jgi:hypothetical protein
VPLISALLLANAGGDSLADDFEKELQVIEFLANRFLSPAFARIIVVAVG